MRTYYCDCGKSKEVIKNKPTICDCGHNFDSSFKTSNHVNMRTTWSGQTQVEFNQTTIGKDIESRGGTW